MIIHVEIFAVVFHERVIRLDCGCDIWHCPVVNSVWRLVSVRVYVKITVMNSRIREYCNTRKGR